jgi:hypothetical protein
MEKITIIIGSRVKIALVFAYLYLASMVRGAVSNVFKFSILATLTIGIVICFLIFMLLSIMRFFLGLLPYPGRSEPVE